MTQSEHKYGPLDEGTTTDEPAPNDELRVGREEYDEPSEHDRDIPAMEDPNHWSAWTVEEGKTE